MPKSRFLSRPGLESQEEMMYNKKSFAGMGPLYCCTGRRKAEEFRRNRIPGKAFPKN